MPMHPSTNPIKVVSRCRYYLPSQVTTYMYGGVFSGIKRGSSFQLQCTGLNIMVIFVLEIWEGAKQVKRVGHTAEHRILGWDVYKIWECPLI